MVFPYPPIGDDDIDVSGSVHHLVERRDYRAAGKFGGDRAHEQDPIHRGRLRRLLRRLTRRL